MTWRWAVVIGLACALAAASGRAQISTLRALGIVEVPRLFNLYAPDATALPPERGPGILLRTRPASDAPVAATITAREDLAAREYGYEESGALVYGRDQGWSLVKTTAGVTGWLAPEDSGEFHSLETLLEDGLTYLTEEWDGFLSTTAGGTDRVRLPGDPDRRIVGHVTPVLPHVTVVLEPGQDIEEVRRQYRSLCIGSRPGPNDRRVLDVETGVVLPLFEGPNVASPPMAHVETNRAGEVLQTTHQSPTQVLVFDTRPGWFQVTLVNDSRWRGAKRAWLQASALWRFHPVDDETEARELADRAWGPEDWSVRVVGFQLIGDTLWANVEVMSESECGATKPPTVRARGWVPAHAPSGEPNVWFYSRGC